MTLYVEQTKTSKWLRHPASEKKITAAEFAQMGELGHGELIKGVFVEMPPPSYEHARIELRLARLLANHVFDNDLGEVFVGEGGLLTQLDPDTVRGMDIAYMSHERFAQVTDKTYLDVAPEWVIEILSPSNRWQDIQDKLDEYFAVGVNLVWIVQPKRKQVFVYQAPDDYVRFTAEDDVTGGNILPAFRISLQDIFTK